MPSSVGVYVGISELDIQPPRSVEVHNHQVEDLLYVVSQITEIPDDVHAFSGLS